MQFHVLDDHHIEVLAGDIAKGIWKFAAGAISREGEETVPLVENTESLEIRLKRKVSNLDTMSDLPMGGLIGAALGTVLGPVGSIANSAIGLVAGDQEFFCIGCRLTDGRRFIARMRGSVLKQVRKLSKTVKEKDS